MPGFPPEWEVRDSLTALVAQVQRLRPLMEAVKPEEWSRQARLGGRTRHNGSPSPRKWTTWPGQPAELAAEPERLTVALETYLRMQSLDAVLASLNEGVRKYQNPRWRTSFTGRATDCENQRQILGQYIVRLAAAKEQQFQGDG